MPNTSEGASFPGPPGLQRPADGAAEPGLIGSLTRDGARTRRASSAELHLQWTCPVTHSREKFYTVCSDYALLNQAAAVSCPPKEARSTGKQDAKPRAPPRDLSCGGAPVGAEGPCGVEEVPSGHTKPLLAWEIDTADFNAAYTRKIRTSKIIMFLLKREFTSFVVWEALEQLISYLL